MVKDCGIIKNSDLIIKFIIITHFMHYHLFVSLQSYP